MPTSSSCFSCPGNVPPGAGTRDAAQRALPGVRRMPLTCCFSYSPDVPAGVSGAAGRMAVTWCFSYLPAVPSGPADRGDVPPGLPGLRQMPFGSCFRY